MHPLRDRLPVGSPEAVIPEAARLRAFGIHVEQEIDGWRPSIESWLGHASFSHHRAIAVLKAPAPAMTAAISQVADHVSALGRAISNAQDELVRLARTLEASISESPSNNHDVAIANDLRRRIEARIEEIHDHLRALDVRTARWIDQVVTERFRPPSSPGAQSRPWNQRQRLENEVHSTRRQIERHVASLKAAIADLASRPGGLHAPSETVHLTHLRKQAALHRRFLEPGRQILDWDPAGDGRIVEVFGELGTAQHIAVVVPGIMNTIENFDRVHGQRSKDIWKAASEIDDETAVVAWLGYDTPELTNAASKSRAEQYEPALRSFIDDLPSDAHVTVVAHSYGTVLAGEAAAESLDVSDLVVLGSPGTRFEQAEQMRLGPDAQVWAGVSDTDRLVGRSSITSIFCPEVAIGAGWLAPARWIISPVTIPVSRSVAACLTDGDGDVKGLSHGTNPAHEDFGAIEIDTSGVPGHSSYFGPDTSTLEEIARIVTGTHPEQD